MSIVSSVRGLALQAKAVSETPSGGQIIVCADTFAAVKRMHRTALARAVPARPELVLLAQLLRSALQIGRNHRSLSS